MNSFVKGQILTEIRKITNKIQRQKVGADEWFTVSAPTGRVMLEIVNGETGRLCRVGGEQIDVDDKDFNEIVMELHICYASDDKDAVFVDEKPKISPDVFRIKKEK